MSDDHDKGLGHDLPRLISRRRALGVMLGGLGSAVVVACGGSGSTLEAASTAAATGGDSIPEETWSSATGTRASSPPYPAASTRATRSRSTWACDHVQRR